MKLSDRLEKRRIRNPNKIEPKPIIMNAILDRLTENSTWRGMILLATSLGVAIPNAYHEAIVAVGLALIGLINVFRREKK